jgi:hypothetical protein
MWHDLCVPKVAEAYICGRRCTDVQHRRDVGTAPDGVERRRSRGSRGVDRLLVRHRSRIVFVRANLRRPALRTGVVVMVGRPRLTHVNVSFSSGSNRMTTRIKQVD